MARLGEVIVDENYYEIFEDMGAVWYIRNGQAKAYVVKGRLKSQETEEELAERVRRDIRERFKED